MSLMGRIMIHKDTNAEALYTASIPTWPHMNANDEHHLAQHDEASLGSAYMDEPCMLQSRLSLTSVLLQLRSRNK